RGFRISSGCTDEAPALERRELVAGKVKALMERSASRDLYDLARRAASTPARWMSRSCARS
ncbi:MAG: nucleotidyl transferase AbiEii/AbiGii toxin family protein, partial [Actinomycetes bacterium]